MCSGVRLSTMEAWRDADWSHEVQKHVHALDIQEMFWISPLSINRDQEARGGKEGRQKYLKHIQLQDLFQRS